MTPQKVETNGPLDEAFEILCHESRRRILGSLLVKENNCDLLVEELVDVSKDRDRQRVALYHNHLPKLKESGYIEWDRESRTICRGPQFGEIAAFIRIVKDSTDELPGKWS